MSIMQKIDDVPAWVNVAVMGAGWAASILQPIAITITIVWGAVQIYVFVKKHFSKQTRRRRDD